ncbi:MAG TPA: bile acid:sodium symporter family protein [Stellaceae bacterium]|nr:bile acid:sodium symporter family protein [Stellaceae bacterium]
MRIFAWLRPDGFTAALLATVALATLAPLPGAWHAGFAVVTRLAISLVFFLHGARLKRATVVQGLANWRLHLAVMAATFALFPLLGLAVAPFVPAAIAPGILFLCCLPSTMQASVAFTAIAGGNVAASVCSASISNLAGVAITPLLVALVFGTSGGVTPGAIENIVLTVLLPFGLGQLVHPWLGPFLVRNLRVLGIVDRASILLVVYGAFADAVAGGLWHELTPATLAAMAGADALLLALGLAITTWGSRRLGFSRADEIAIVFCGSKKSLVAGVPMANILFPSGAGLILLPLMLFHQIQLMACAMLARRYAGRQATLRAGIEVAAEPAE